MRQVNGGTLPRRLLGVGAIATSLAGWSFFDGDAGMPGVARAAEPQPTVFDQNWQSPVVRPIAPVYFQQGVDAPPPEVAPGETPPAEMTPNSEPPPAAAKAEGEEEEPKEQEMWVLTNIFDDGCGGNWFKEHNIRLGGNVAQSMTFNFQSPSDRFNGPVTWTDRSNEYQLNQLWFYMEKTTDTSKKDFDIGGRFDVLYGTNSRLTTESGLEVGHLNAGHAFYGTAFPQFYVETAYKKLKIKTGHFISPVGYFTVDTTQNFFNTIPYTYQWGEPFTHTGSLATYQFSDQFVAGVGLIRGWDNFDNSNPNLGVMGTEAYTWKDKSSLAHVWFYSHEPNQLNQFTRRYYQSLVYSKPLSEKTNYVIQSDFGVQDNALVNGKTAHWYGVNQYLFYIQNEKVTWGLNFEWWRDEQGFRVAGFLPGSAPSGITGPNRGWGTSPFQGGYNGNFFQTTMGPKIQFTKNLFLRPNLRFDWYNGHTNDLNPAQLKPFNDGKSDFQALFVTDLCLLF
ncbi:MAG TPA: outer membrane beta-barrel protein [Planctomycetaceae bacterium]|nr:outer membrane beta-barrel protein [Planctomycetaceae bacterium]